jgi:hypothetical protein
MPITVAIILLLLFVLGCVGHVLVAAMLAFDWLGGRRSIRHHDHLIPSHPRSYRSAH